MCKLHDLNKNARLGVHGLPERMHAMQGRRQEFEEGGAELKENVWRPETTPPN